MNGCFPLTKRGADTAPDQTVGPGDDNDGDRQTPEKFCIKVCIKAASNDPLLSTSPALPEPVEAEVRQVVRLARAEPVDEQQRTAAAAPLEIQSRSAHFTARTSSVRMSGSLASRSGPTWPSAAGI